MEPPVITLKPLQHRGEECIGIYFKHNNQINNLVRNNAKARWSQTKKVWWLPMSRTSYNTLFVVLKGKAEIEKSALQQYLIEKKKNQVSGIEKKHSSSSLVPRRNIQLPEINKQITHSPGSVKSNNFYYKSGNIHAVNSHVLPAMRQRLKLKAYSISTIRTYINEMAQLLQTIKNIPADELTPEHLRRYLVYCFERLGLKENTLHSRINALKFYYEQVLEREKFFWEIPRPKKQQLLPRFFNQNEIVTIIKSTGNLKHKLMLMLAYSAGLRVSEVVSIKTKNIDEYRMSILVEQAKGKKDRMVVLSPVLLVILREYIKEYKPEKSGYLFSGQWAGEPYSTRSLQLVIAAAKEKAGIIKPGSIHALRHSFATHLLDRGTDVTLIMKLMGHNDIKTTMRYLHITNRDILQIISPIDDLRLE